MLCWVLVFVGTAIVASLRGLGGLASTAAGIAEVLFFVFLIAFVVALVMGSVRHRPAARDPIADPGDAAEAPAASDSPIGGRPPRVAPDDRGRARPRHDA
jgi:uncharacterized membrane protein YtjA (UPF0391 family)